MKKAVEAINEQFETLARSKNFSKVIYKAFYFACDAHKDQKRKLANEPYIIHPFRVMQKLLEMNPSDEVLVAALLHDVVEDTGKSIDEIESQFGSRVAKRILGLTKTEREPLIKTLEEGAREFPDIILIRIADRLDNLADGEKLPIRVREKYSAQYQPLIDLVEKFKISSPLLEEFKRLQSNI